MIEQSHGKSGLQLDRGRKIHGSGAAIAGLVLAVLGMGSEHQAKAQRYGEPCGANSTLSCTGLAVGSVCLSGRYTGTCKRDKNSTACYCYIKDRPR